MKSVTPVPSLAIEAIELEHEGSGAGYLHLDTGDVHNTFAVGFRTPPTSDNGVFHILEHMVLCSSAKYAARDVFFNLSQRTLATFLNAMTAADSTLYPFSTVNATDFANVLDVYCDAVFFPNLTAHDFDREGWRHELAQPKGDGNDLKYHGIVFNEMKGVVTDPGAWFYYQLKALRAGAPLGPDGFLPQEAQHDPALSPYAYNSGGDPLVIPSLSHAELKDAHTKYYSPSNAVFFSYGDLPLSHHLAYLEENVFAMLPPSRASRGDGPALLPHLPEDIPVSSSQGIVIPGPHDSLAAANAQVYHGREYLSHHVASSPLGATLNLQVLSSLLVDGPASPVYKAVIEAGLATDYSARNGANTEMASATMGFTFQGVPESDGATARIDQALDAALAQAASEGFDQARIDALLHQIEISIRSRPSNYGLSLASNVLHSHMLGVPLQDSVNVEAMLDQFKEDPQGILAETLDSLLASTPVSLTVLPDKDFLASRDAIEASALESAAASMSDADRAGLVETTEAFYEREGQDVSHLADTLPALSIDDCSEELLRKNETQVGSSGAYLNSAPTNGIVYTRAMVRVPDSLPAASAGLLPLYSSLLPSLGTDGPGGKVGYSEVDQAFQLHTGSFSMSLAGAESVSDSSSFTDRLLVSGSFLEDKAEKALELMATQVLHPDWSDLDRIGTLIGSHVSELSSSIQYSGHSFAMSNARARLTRPRARSEFFSGLSQLNVLVPLGNDLAASESYAASDLLGSTLEKLSDLHKTLQDSAWSATALSLVAPDGSAYEDRLNSWVTDDLKSSIHAPFRAETDPSVPDSLGSTFVPDFHSEYISLPYQVHYTATAIPTVASVHPDAVRLKVLANILSAEYLLPVVRQQGGAYGAGAVADAGTFTFFSYRDPNARPTLEAFRGSFQFLNSLSDADLGAMIKRAQLRGVAALDAPLAPSQAGAAYFLGGVEDELRQQLRSELFAVDVASVRAAAATYLDFDEIASTSTIIGPSSTPESDPFFAPGSGWDVIDPAQNQQ